MCVQKRFMEIVLATRNRKKAEEIRRITEGFPVTVYTLDDFPGCPEVVEDGVTFEDNAVKKAVSVAHFTGKPALADDSGLEVAALHGAPGTLSARFAGEPPDDVRNVNELLRMMRGVERREARFVCCIAFALPDGRIFTFHGYVEGSIGDEPKGSHGFGYDPVFYPLGSQLTFAEMAAGEKDAISHRGQALEAFKRFFLQWISGEGGGRGGK